MTVLWAHHADTLTEEDWGDGSVGMMRDARQSG